MKTSNMTANMTAFRIIDDTVDSDEMVELFDAINNGEILDHHSGKMIRIAGLAVLNNGITVGLFNTSYFSMNMVGQDDNGQVYLSTWSVGGVCHPWKVGRDMGKAIEKYNAEYDEYVEDAARLGCDLSSSLKNKVAAYILF